VNDSQDADIPITVCIWDVRDLVMTNTLFGPKVSLTSIPGVKLRVRTTIYKFYNRICGLHECFVLHSWEYVSGIQPQRDSIRFQPHPRGLGHGL